MAIGSINNNTATQLQAYAQEKATATAQSSQGTPAAKTVVSSADSVQISEQAKALLAQDVSNSTQGNGGGIIPPGNAPVTAGVKGTVGTLGNGGGIIPPGNAPVSGDGKGAASTLGNGGGIIPPGNAPVTGGDDAAVTTLGNGGGIIPPGN
jgi:hypothetical protein